MVARRMAEERLFAVITSNSSHSVQKSCCVIATSSSTMRTLGFVIIFLFPVTDQNRAVCALNLHLRSIPFRRMPGIRELHTRFYRNNRASRGAHGRTRISRRKRGGIRFDATQSVHRSGQGEGRCVNNCEQAPSGKAKGKRQKAKVKTERQRDSHQPLTTKDSAAL